MFVVFCQDRWWCAQTPQSVPTSNRLHFPLSSCLILITKSSFSTQGHAVVVDGERMAGTEFSMCRWKLSVCHSASVLQRIVVVTFGLKVMLTLEFDTYGTCDVYEQLKFKYLF